ncbi:hypothetical protein [Nocardia brasiliensis]|uniref:hypothetical protein n=1 Tax=Nocardia brasiliensis TaxID=37326 RepID=UPI00189351F8|nr:hypothetical protein [Nocardia brasiliensis]MBF6125053.1 hypothetical protein [Nocardia brasiliensis]
MADASKHAWTDATQLEARLDAEFYQPHFLDAERKLARVPTQRFQNLWRDSNRIYIGIAGFPEKTEERAYTPYIRPTDVGTNGEIDWNRIAWCHAEWLDDYSDNGCAKAGDLLVEVKGNTRRVAIVDSDVPANCIVSGSFWRLTLTDSVNPRFVLAYLLSDTGQLLKRRWVSNSVISWIDPHSFRRFQIPVPDRRIQDYIGAKVELAERCRAVASREREELGTELATFYEGCPHDTLSSSLTTMVAPAEINGSRLDAWYHQRRFITLTEWLRRNPAFVELGKVASLSSGRWSPGAHGQSTFRYIEISDVDSSTGHVSHSEVPVENAPSRARKLLRGFDVLVSTVRPNRGVVGLVPDSLDGAVATTGFAVVRAASKTDAFFLLAVLRHPASTAQLMRCNTGSAYPAIEESVLPQISIPGAKPATRKNLGARELRRTTLLQTAVDLVAQAKTDVEALIEGTLDVHAILAGKLKPPTADDILELAEDDA